MEFLEDQQNTESGEWTVDTKACTLITHLTYSCIRKFYITINDIFNYYNKTIHPIYKFLKKNNKTKCNINYKQQMLFFNWN